MVSLMTYHTRDDFFREEHLPRYRERQVWEALFSPQIRSFDDITTLPRELRERLTETMPFLSFDESRVLVSARKDTLKAWLKLGDGQAIEAVLMKNTRDDWTLCVSSQVGCAMGCTFCATGTMGFKRNLSADEIVDQYRFFLLYLADREEFIGRISNIVYMGMGEPFANYENVRASLNLILAHTDIGPTRITVSSVGHLARLTALLADEKWPPVRLAISLHSAVPETRKKLMPTSYPEFLERLSEWAKRYAARYPEVRRYLTFEYVLLSGVNDDQAHAKALARFANEVGNVRINLIPYNRNANRLTTSTPDASDAFQTYLKDHGVTVTRRRPMGDDIAAACGQLVVLNHAENV